ncbi:MAG TPA: hypothetical protein EYQ00_00485, partial [Dehalococcoidia bacterium]|nr:hypothetical protein [Dehalococcoidia bacterium]
MKTYIAAVILAVSSGASAFQTTPLTDTTTTSDFDGSKSTFVGAIGISQSGDRVGLMIDKYNFAFVDLEKYVCATSLDSDFQPEVRVNARFESEGVLIRSFSLTMDVRPDRRSVTYWNWMTVGSWVRAARLAETMKVQIVDGCGQYSLITFDLRGSQSNLMKQWFPHRYEVACAKSTKKAKKLALLSSLNAKLNKDSII